MKGIGIDLCQISRIEQAMKQNERFLQRWYTDEEQQYILSRGQAGAQSAAAIFAAKEAFLKAVGMGIGRGVTMTDVSVRHDELGAPQYVLSGAAQQKMQELGAQRTWLSLTHEAGMAAAFCVIE